MRAGTQVDIKGGGTWAGRRGVVRKPRSDTAPGSVLVDVWLSVSGAGHPSTYSTNIPAADLAVR